jgi:hypothetical protein
MALVTAVRFAVQRRQFGPSLDRPEIRASLSLLSLC